MEQRITLITLGVRDLASSRRFYEALGWQRSVRKAEGVAFYQAGPIVLALYPAADLARDAGRPLAQDGTPPMSLALNLRSAEEVDAALAEAETAGAHVLKRGHKVFWGGYIAYFADPDGFIWELAWNPSFELLPDGTLRLPD